MTKYKNPHVLGKIINPNYNPLVLNSPEEIPGFVPGPTHLRGVAILHEVLGHVYLRFCRPTLSSREHDHIVEEFETMVRQIYLIGVYSKKEAKKEVKKGNMVNEGDNKYLKGESQIHESGTLQLFRIK